MKWDGSVKQEAEEAFVIIELAIKWYMVYMVLGVSHEARLCISCSAYFMR